MRLTIGALAAAVLAQGSVSNTVTSWHSAEPPAPRRLDAPPDWLALLSRGIESTWCNRSISYMDKAMVEVPGRPPTTRWAKNWDATHVNPGLDHYSLVWHEMVPHAEQALLGAVRTNTSRQLRHLARSGHIYCFGVAQGHSMSIMSDVLPGRRLFGFDSFAGLPPEDHASSKISSWGSGMFKPGKMHDGIGNMSGRAVTPEAIVQDAGGPSMARVFPGFFSNTLKPGLAQAEGMGPALYVDIDCDLHTSTATVLDWLFTERIAQPGTLIGYDVRSDRTDGLCLRCCCCCCCNHATWLPGRHCTASHAVGSHPPLMNSCAAWMCVPFRASLAGLVDHLLHQKTGSARESARRGRGPSAQRGHPQARRQV